MNTYQRFRKARILVAMLTLAVVCCFTGCGNLKEKRTLVDCNIINKRHVHCAYYIDVEYKGIHHSVEDVMLFDTVKVGDSMKLILVDSYTQDGEYVKSSLKALD